MTGKNKGVVRDLYSDKAKRMIPGLSQLLSKSPTQFAPGSWPSYYQKASGARLWDLDGNEYLDMSISGIGANVLGYADPDVDSAVKKVIDLGSSSSLNCPEEIILAEKLIAMHPWAEKARFARTGGEAMAIAVRIARTYRGRDKILFCGYHGWHDWYLAANLSDIENLDGHLLPGLSPMGVPQGLVGTALPFEYNNIDDFKAKFLANRDELAAVVMEPIRSVSPNSGFLEEVRRLTNEDEIPLVFDEISSGFRLNSGGAHLKFGVNPDVAVFSKALGNGYPIAAIIGASEVMDATNSSFISSTNWTERIGPTAAIAVMEKHFKNDVSSHLNNIGRQVQEGWKSIAREASVPISVSGIYPLSHYHFDVPNHLECKTFVVQEMIKLGILSSTLFYPMYAHTRADVATYLEGLSKVFSKLSKCIGDGSVASAIKGEVVGAGFKRLT